MHVRDAYVSFPSLCGSSECDYGFLSGKFDFFWPFWGALMRSDCFQALASHSQLSACVQFDVSVGFSSLSGSPMCSSAPLAGKFCVTNVLDASAGVFKLLAMLYMRVYVSDTSVWSLGLFAPCAVLRHWQMSLLADAFAGLPNTVRIVPVDSNIFLLSGTLVHRDFVSNM